jgi:gluconate 2-dehydrogenase gamma chain
MATDDLLPERLATLRAAMERVLPSDCDGPGAAEAGAADYVERALEAGIRPAVRQRLLEGLDLLACMARDLHGRPFADCTPEERDALLSRISEIPHPVPRRFLRSLITLTVQGFLCDPRQHGNRGGLGWGYVGYAPGPGEGGETA